MKGVLLKRASGDFRSCKAFVFGNDLFNAQECLLLRVSRWTVYQVGTEVLADGPVE